MHLVDLAVLVIDRARSELEQFSNQHRGIAGGHVGAVECDQVPRGQAQVQRSLAGIHRQFHHVHCQRGQLHHILGQQAHAHVADGGEDLGLGGVVAWPVAEHPVPAALIRHEPAIEKGLLGAPEPLALIDQVQLRPEVHQALRPGRAGQLHHARRGVLAQRLDRSAFSGGQIAQSAVVENDHVVGPP